MAGFFGFFSSSQKTARPSTDDDPVEDQTRSNAHTALPNGLAVRHNSPLSSATLEPAGQHDVRKPSQAVAPPSSKQAVCSDAARKPYAISTVVPGKAPLGFPKPSDGGAALDRDANLHRERVTATPLRSGAPPVELSMYNVANGYDAREFKIMNQAGTRERDAYCLPVGNSAFKSMKVMGQLDLVHDPIESTSQVSAFPPASQARTGVTSVSPTYPLLRPPSGPLKGKKSNVTLPRLYLTNAQPPSPPRVSLPLATSRHLRMPSKMYRSSRRPQPPALSGPDPRPSAKPMPSTTALGSGSSPSLNSEQLFQHTLFLEDVRMLASLGLPLDEMDAIPQSHVENSKIRAKFQTLRFARLAEYRVYIEQDKVDLSQRRRLYGSTINARCNEVNSHLLQLTGMIKTRIRAMRRRGDQPGLTQDDWNKIQAFFSHVSAYETIRPSGSYSSAPSGQVFCVKQGPCAPASFPSGVILSQSLFPQGITEYEIPGHQSLVGYRPIQSGRVSGLEGMTPLCVPPVFQNPSSQPKRTPMNTCSHI
ncbi:hypothetical protein PG993_011557 [Apiospora rasikravindrae]|uniref:Uncharacterized protein n=1 Tax=Apiospora rasikravindrae TaxID=990691 RepID=A0ABR1SEJ7_9PEZI